MQRSTHETYHKVQTPPSPQQQRQRQPMEDISRAESNIRNSNRREARSVSRKSNRVLARNLRKHVLMKSVSPLTSSILRFSDNNNSNTQRRRQNWLDVDSPMSSNINDENTPPSRSRRRRGRSLEKTTRRRRTVEVKESKCQKIKDVNVVVKRRRRTTKKIRNEWRVVKKKKKKERSVRVNVNVEYDAEPASTSQIDEHDVLEDDMSISPPSSLPSIPTKRIRWRTSLVMGKTSLLHNTLRRSATTRHVRSILKKKKKNAPHQDHPRRDIATTFEERWRRNTLQCVKFYMSFVSPSPPVTASYEDSVVGVFDGDERNDSPFSSKINTALRRLRRGGYNDDADRVQGTWCLS